MSDAPDGARPDESVPTPKTTLGSRRADFDARAQAARHDLENQIRSRRAQLGARNEKLTARTGRNLPAAIAVGVGLGAAVLLSLIFEPAFFMIVAGALIGSLCFESVVRLYRRFRRAAKPSVRMMRATRLRPTRTPSARSSACTRGLP